MSTIEVWFLAIALAMDCFAISIASGVIQKRIVLKPLLITALLFGLFQAGTPVIGWYCAEHFIEYIKEFDHWIAFVLLGAVGGKMVWEGLKKDATAFNPTSLRVILTLALATSIDALAIGISFGCMNMDTFGQILYPILIIGVVSFIFSIIGIIIGAYAAKKITIRIEVLGGIILIALGMKIVIEHLF